MLAAFNTLRRSAVPCGNGPPNARSVGRGLGKVSNAVGPGLAGSWTWDSFTNRCRTTMRSLRHVSFLVALIVGVGGLCSSQVRPNLQKFFKDYIGLSQDEIDAIQRGKTVAKIIESRTPDEVFVFGAVYIKASPESYLRLAGDIAELQKLPSFLAIRKFSDPPQLSDLKGFTLEQEDIKELKDCKPGHCEVQLPVEAMEEFKRSIKWSAPDREEQVNRLAQRMALEALVECTRGGNAALSTYRDKKRPTEVAETCQSLVSRSKALPAYLPDLDRYLLDYPKFKLENSESQFYWEKVNFGLKPTLRLVHAIVYRGVRPSEPAFAVAVKQIY